METSGVSVANPKYPPLTPVQAAARVETIGRILVDEFLADLTDFPDPDADCLIVEDFVAMGRELPYRRCLECGEPAKTASDIAFRLCRFCRPDGDYALRNATQMAVSR